MESESNSSAVPKMKFEESNYEYNSPDINSDFSPIFRQKDYLWLFNTQMGFSSRKDFQPDSDLPTEDYLQMISINRIKLSNYLSKVLSRYNNQMTDS